MKIISGEMKHIHLLSPVREPTTDQSMDDTKVQLGESMSFTGVTHRSRSDAGRAASPGPTPSWVTAHKRWGTQSTLRSLQIVGRTELVLP